jgi:Protein of unknown function (DUF3618)
MTEIERLERDIEASRARLDLTIDQIQDKLSPSGIVDDVMGSVRRTEFGQVFDQAVEVVRRNPVPVMMVAAGVGWLLYRLAEDRRSPGLVRAQMIEEESVPLIVTGQDRVYDPDASSRHPSQDLVETRREISARA